MLGNYLKLEVFGIYVQAETGRESKALLEVLKTERKQGKRSSHKPPKHGIAQ